MKTFFECKSRFNAVSEEGKEIVKSETYLVDAVSFTDAEANTISYLEKVVTGSSTVTAIKRSSIEDVINVSDEGKYFTAKVRFISVDDETGKGKMATIQLLVQADTPEETLKGVNEYTKEWVVDISVVQVTESKIVDYIQLEK
jgi:hypothetical protein